MTLQYKESSSLKKLLLIWTLFLKLRSKWKTKMKKVVMKVDLKMKKSNHNLIKSSIQESKKQLLQSRTKIADVTSHLQDREY